MTFSTRSLSHARSAGRDQLEDTDRAYLWINSMQDSWLGLAACCAVTCEHPDAACTLRRSKTDARLIRLRDELVSVGEQLPTLRAQEVIATVLSDLERTSALKASLSDDGEGGIFGEWLVGDDRLTLSVDGSGTVSFRAFTRGLGWRDSSMDDFKRQLDLMERRLRTVGILV